MCIRDRELKDQGEIKTYPEVVDIFEMSEITSIATAFKSGSTTAR